MVRVVTLHNNIIYSHFIQCHTNILVMLDLKKCKKGCDRHEGWNTPMQQLLNKYMAMKSHNTSHYGTLFTHKTLQATNYSSIIVYFLKTVCIAMVKTSDFK